MKKTIIYSLAILIASAFTLTSCEATKNANNTQKGAAIGTAAGAIIGGVIGNNVGNKKNSELGAILGGVIVGVTGGVIGNKLDKQAREIEARKELGAKEFARQKNKEGRKSGSPKEFKSRPEERKYGGKVMKKNMGGPVRKRVGMASKMTSRKAGGPVRQRYAMATGKK